MNFTIYDIVLLVIFVVFTSIFLYKRRKNLKREGLLFLYKTVWGIKIINRIGNKYKKTLNILGYISIGLGFLLMITMLYVFGKMVWLYVFNGDIIKLIKIPPITPLIPYLPQLFKLNFLPPFYFIYWILIIAIVAISHEFSHGLFAVNKKIKIKSTGFGFFPFFLPIFLAAFLELDEKKIEKKKISSQMAVLSAGTFANILVAILFLGILFIFFSLSFTPSGVVFDTYTYSAVSIATISSVNNINITNATYDNILTLAKNTALNKVKSNNTAYWITESFLEQQKGSSGYLLLYDDAPAIKANLSNTIIKINGIEIESKEQLGKELLKHSPGSKIIVTTLFDDSFRDYEITLGKNPENSSLPYLGIGFFNQKSSGILGNMMNVFSFFKDSSIYYKPNFAAAEFIYDFLWWLILISFSVALVNMLPVGIFDGGRFFFLMMLALTKSKDKARKIFSAVTYLFLFLLVVIMIFWAINLIK
jgi:membrane-associated protease RseP (regulator of RpoE activity)